MADFDNVRFPEKISLDASGGPQFKTTVAEMATGKEGRIQWWEHARGEWTCSHTAKRPAAGKVLLSFFYVVGQGMANTFRFKDWNDFECANGDGFFIDTEGSPILKQMVKRYRFTGIDGTIYTYDRIISKPITGKVTTDAASLDYATGIAASGTTWYGEFDCWTRLGSDASKFQIITPKPGGYLVSWDGIEIIEVQDEDV